MSAEERRPYTILVVWGDEDPDEEYFDVDAVDFEDACHLAYAEWAATGWHGLSVYDLDTPKFRSFNLDLPFEEGTTHGG